MNESTIKSIANSDRTEEEKIRYALHVAGEELIQKSFDIQQHESSTWNLHLRRSAFTEIFGYYPEGWSSEHPNRYRVVRHVRAAGILAPDPILNEIPFAIDDMYVYCYTKEWSGK